MLKCKRLFAYSFPVAVGWVLFLNAGAQADPTVSPDDPVEKGREIYDRFGCYQCHGHFGQGGLAGPALAPDPIPYKTFAKIVRRPPAQMPAYTQKVLSEEQLSEIYLYIESIEQGPLADDVPLLR